MAKKGRDLFELLQLRESEGAPARSKRTRGESATKSRKDSQSGKTASAASAGFSISSPVLSAMVLGALGAGFMLGRVTAGAEGQGELRAASKSLAPNDFPLGPAPEPGAGDLAPEEEVMTLSKYFFVIAALPSDERHKASRLAYHLRQNGVETARIKWWEHKEGVYRWVVLVYVPGATKAEVRENLPDCLASLKAVPNPEFESRLKATVDKLDWSKLMIAQPK